MAGRRIELLVDDAELEARRAAFVARPVPGRGWRRLYAQRVEQALLDVDLDVLTGEGAATPRD